MQDQTNTSSTSDEENEEKFKRDAKAYLQKLIDKKAKKESCMDS